MRTIFLLTAVVLFYTPSILAESPLTTYIKEANPKVTNWEANTIVKKVLRYSAQRGLDPILVLAIIDVESKFNPRAASSNPRNKSEKWSLGLMQVNKYAWLYKKHKHNLYKIGLIQSEKDLYNIDLNVKAGTFIFSKTKEYCQSWKQSGRLKSKKYKNVFQCSIASYNGSKHRFHYLDKVVSSMHNIRSSFYKNKQNCYICFSRRTISF